MALLGAQPAVCVYQQHVNNLLPEEKEGFYKVCFGFFRLEKSESGVS